jgi:hypothetical protein
MTKPEAIRKYLSYKGFNIIEVTDEDTIWVRYRYFGDYPYLRIERETLEKYFQCSVMFFCPINYDQA